MSASARRVDVDHRVAERGEVRGVATGAAGSIDSSADWEAVDDLAHDRLFDVDELIARLVVGGGPSRRRLPWSVGIALASYLWARHLYTRRRSAWPERKNSRAQQGLSFRGSGGVCGRNP